MKKKYLLCFFFISITTAVVIVLANKPVRRVPIPLASSDNGMPSNLKPNISASLPDSGKQSPSNIIADEQSKVPQGEIIYKSDATKQVDGSLKVITNPKSGEYAVINSDGKMLGLRDKANNSIWSKDIVAALGTNLPLYFRGRIDSMYVYDDALVLTVGNEFIEIDKRDGNIMRRSAR